MNPWHLAWGTHVENLAMDNLSSLLRHYDAGFATVSEGLHEAMHRAPTDMMCMHQLVAEAIKISSLPPGDAPSFWHHAEQAVALASLHHYVADFHAFYRGNQAPT
jgi:hypothetical protein